MNVQPTLQFSFEPTCQRFFCCCCDGNDDDILYPTKAGKFRPVKHLSDAEIEKANARFHDIIKKKLSPLPFDTIAFMESLQYEHGIDFEVTENNPITKSRIDDTVKKINYVLSHMKIS